MAADGFESVIHCVHRDVGTTCVAPRSDLSRQIANAVPLEHYPIRAEVFHRPVQGTQSIRQPFPLVDDLAGGAAEEDEAIREPGGPLEGDIAMPSEPDRDGLRRLRQERRPVNPIEAAREVDNRLCKQPTQKLNLLLLPGAAGMEVLPKSFVFDVVPADTYAKPQSTTRQEINVGRLPRDERRLALRKDKDTRGETETLRHGCQIREHHERVMERVVFGVRAGEWWRPTGVDGAEHVVVREEVVKAQVLDRFTNQSDSVRGPSKLDLRVDHANLHRASVCHGSKRLRAPTTQHRLQRSRIRVRGDRRRSALDRLPRRQLVRVHRHPPDRKSERLIRDNSFPPWALRLAASAFLQLKHSEGGRDREECWQNCEENCDIGEKNGAMDGQWLIH